MKKLMIAAAAAAMIGGAYAAAGTTYDATFNLKTTVGKYGQAKKVNYYLGADFAHTTMWYDDTSLATFRTNALYFTTKRVSGVTIPCLTALAKKDNEWLKTYIKPLATEDKTGGNSDSATYGYKSGGKWCETITIQPDGLCYRTAGTIKISTSFDDDCCFATYTPAILNAFGAASFATCTKAELYGDLSSALPLTCVDNVKCIRSIGALHIAGQGSFGKVIYDYDINGDKKYNQQAGVVSISGYAVGTVDAPECTTCCVTNVPSSTWTCAGADEDGDSAVYGTFTLKYNAAKTKKLVNP